jgi:hypothetical protein
MRSGEDPAGPKADKDARKQALARMKKLLKKTLGAR